MRRWLQSQLKLSNGLTLAEIITIRQYVAKRPLMLHLKKSRLLCDHMKRIVTKRIGYVVV